MAQSSSARQAEFVGQVRGIQTREEPPQTVWSFRVERFDEDGNLVQRLPVEMRGLSFHGSIAEGDLVRVWGHHQHGTLIATRVEDLTTGAVVEARGLPPVVKISAVVFGAGFLITTVVFVVIFIIVLSFMFG